MRILVLGAVPPPLQPHARLEAINYRTWQFVQPLLSDGHQLCLCVDSSSASAPAGNMAGDLCLETLYFNRVGWISALQRIHDRYAPDCILAVDFYPSLWATRLNTSRPMWMDLYGDPLTMMQVARYRAGSDQGIGTVIALANRILRRGDLFSTCGIPQQHMLAGELAMAGRLNSRAFGYKFVQVVYPGAPPALGNADEPDGNAIRVENGLPADAFVVLWCGGYNTWTDVDTLYRGLEAAMDRDPRVHFLSVGASTYEAAETVYDRFTARCRASRHAARLHFLGWRRWEEIPSFYAASDLGINVDAQHYETIYGTRTRLVEMLAHGLPVITSEGCELSSMLPAKGAGVGFASGRWEDLARGVVTLAPDRQRHEDMRRAARTLAAGDLSFAVTTTALRSWVKTPTCAPDRFPPTWSDRLRHASYGLRTVARLGLWQLGLSGERQKR